MRIINPSTSIDEWLNRFFSLSFILTAATALFLSKAILMMNSYDGEVTQPINEPEPLPTIPDIALVDQSKFVPWPSVLPEPAAGPEEGQPVSDGELLDPSTLTEGEILALKQLMARRQALDEREKLLDMRAELNGRAETKLDEQIEKLAGLKEQLEMLMKGLDEDEELRIARLVKIYETMKPKAAAEIFNRLEIKILIHVIDRMKEAKSAAVLAKMDPAIAKRITTELAKKKERPVLNGGEA